MFVLKNALAVVAVSIALLLLAGCFGGGTPETTNGNGGTGGGGNGGNGSQNGAGTNAGGANQTNASEAQGIEIDEARLDEIIGMCAPGEYAYALSGCEGLGMQEFEVEDIGFYEGEFTVVRKWALQVVNMEKAEYVEWLESGTCVCAKTQTVAYVEGKEVRVDGQCPVYERGERKRLADESVSVPAYSGIAAKYEEGDAEKSYYWVAPAGSGISVPVKYEMVSEACTTTGELVK